MSPKLTIIKIRTTLHKFTDTDGKPVFLRCVFYHLPQTYVRLFSPQTCHQMHGGYSKFYAESIQMKLRTSTISITIKQGLTNLPVVHDSFVSEMAKRCLRPHAVWTMSDVHLCFGFLGRLTRLYPPLLLNQNNLSFPVSHVLVIQQMRI
jgi:hypothetical protein